MDRILNLIACYCDVSMSNDEHEVIFEKIISICNVNYFGIDNDNCKCGIAQMIQCMEKQLISVIDKERNRVTFLLAEILVHASEAITHIPTINLLLTFFCARLHDYPSILPCLHGLNALAGRHISAVLTNAVGRNQSQSAVAQDTGYAAPTELLILKVLQALDLQLPSHVQGLAQSIRMKVFLLIHTICSSVLRPIAVSPDICCFYIDIFSGTEEERFRKELQAMDVVCHCVEGEKDPRCLLQTLQIITLAVQVFPASVSSVHQEDQEGKHYEGLISAKKMAERVYSCIVCYFPISFTPPPFVSPSDTVTSEDLVLAAD